MYLLEGADDSQGVACLGGECFGEAGHGFLRLSCAEPEDRLLAAVDFMKQAFADIDRLQSYRTNRPEFQRDCPYEIDESVFNTE